MIVEGLAVRLAAWAATVPAYRVRALAGTTALVATWGALRPRTGFWRGALASVATGAVCAWLVRPRPGLPPAWRVSS